MTIACWITSVRFILAPLIFWQLTTRSGQGIIWTLIFLFLAAATDVTDGWVARTRNEVSELGKALDPLADKLVILGTLLGLVWSGLPFWMVLIYLAKEALQVVVGACMLRRLKRLIPSNWWGKSSTVLFFIGFGVFFINHLAGTLIIGLGILLATYAMFTYYQAFLRLKND